MPGNIVPWHACCCGEDCFETWDITLTQHCFRMFPAAVAPDPQATQMFQMCCPPYLRDCMYPGTIDWVASGAGSSCTELAGATRSWRMFTHEAISGAREAVNTYWDLLCANYWFWDTAEWHPIMWVINDPLHLKYGWRRAMVLLKGSASAGWFVAFAGELPPGGGHVFSNLLPDALADWCVPIQALTQIGTGGYFEHWGMPYSLPVCDVDCTRPESVTVTLIGFDGDRLGCSNCPIGIFDSNDNVHLSGIDGVYVVPYTGAATTQTDRYTYAIPGSLVEWDMYNFLNCVPDIIGGSDSLGNTSGVTITIDLFVYFGNLLMSQFNISAGQAPIFSQQGCNNASHSVPPNYIPGGWCQGTTYGSANACIWNGGTALVERTP